jgi:ABC-type Fe3+-hydroxamate transport system substrate-binding protein
MQHEFIDQMGNLLRLNHPPQRIISIVPSQTELLADWGLDESVVGITKFCIHPSNWFDSKTKVGGTKKINLEAIKALNPDLIIGNKEENSKTDIELLQENYPVWMSDINNLDDCFDMILGLGKILGCLEKAEKTVDSLKHSFNQLAPKIPEITGLKVAYFIWQEPFMVAASGTFINEMLKIAGYKNVFESYNRYPEINMELLNALKPDLIFLSSEPYPFKEKHVKYFEEKCPWAKVIIVDGELFSWYGSRLLKSAEYFLQLQNEFSTK